MEIRPNFYIHSEVLLNELKRGADVSQEKIDDRIMSDNGEISEARKHIKESGGFLGSTFSELYSAMKDEKWDKLHSLICGVKRATRLEDKQLFEFIEGKYSGKISISARDKLKLELARMKIKNSRYYQLYKKCVELDEQNPTVLSAMQFIIMAEEAIENLKSYDRNAFRKRR